jgi:hypothetical protein
MHEQKHNFQRRLANCRLVVIEPLESRQLLSATIDSSTLLSVTTPVSVVATAEVSHGVTVYLQEGRSFTGSLGYLSQVSKSLTAHLTITASVNWGDGTDAAAGVVTIGSTGAISVSGTHTYAKAGKFAISVTVTGRPVAIPGQPVPDYIVLLGTIKSRAIVSPANSSGGVTLNEIDHKAFTASVGTFITIAPGTNLHANIKWGDGSSSAGTLKAVKVIGLDEIEFEVNGTHTYAEAGIFGIVVTITHPGLTSTSSAEVITTINSTAIVSQNNLNLDGTITGTYLPAPTAVDVGATYVFNGSGTAGNMGPVAAHGIVTLPGFIATGNASGSLTLTSASATAQAGGTVTLKLTGPTEAGFGPFPSILHFAIESGTGRFAGVTGTGTIAVTLGNKTSTNAFAFVLTSQAPS